MTIHTETFSDFSSIALPAALAQNYTIRSCLKYTEQTGTYILSEKNTGILYLLKTASDPAMAALLSNEKYILDFIHQNCPERISEKLPVSVSLSVFPASYFHVASSDAASSDAAFSGAASSDAASSGAASSDAASSDAASSDAVFSDAASSDAASSDLASSDAASSDAVFSDTASSDAVSSDTASSDAVSSDAAFSDVAFSDSELSLSSISSCSEDALPCTYYIRTYIEGQTLEELCESNYRQPGLPPDKALQYILDLCELLHFLHTLTPPVIHRDIKPQNVIISGDERCHFVDFGISRFYQSDKKSDTVIMGTKLTAPPEQFGYHQTDTRSDLYSLGILLHYSITGEYSITEDTLSGMDHRLQRVIRKATMFDPRKRYQTAREFMNELLHIRYSVFSDAGHFQKYRQGLKKLYLGSFALNIVLLMLLLLLFFVPKSGFYPGDFSRNTLKSDEVSAVEIYTFKEPLIEQAVRSQLHLPNGSLTTEDLAKITEIHIFGQQLYSDDSEFFMDGTSVWYTDDEQRSTGAYELQGTISSLEDIIHMPNLHTLSLYRQRISDISLLKDTSIQKLGLGYNSLSDISPLEHNEHIQSLNLACTEISDDRVLSTLKNLSSLNISDTLILSIEHLTALPLDTLNLVDISLENYGILKEMSMLRNVTLSLLTKDILDEWNGSAISSLRFYDSRDLSLDDFSVLGDLKYLYFSGEQQTVLLAHAPSLPHLQTLELMQFEIENFYGLEHLQNLHRLQIYGSHCIGYEGLDQIPNLHAINCTEAQRQEILALYPDVSYEFTIVG